MASNSLPITGVDDLEKFLAALPANMRRNAVNSGLRAAARVMINEIRARAPKETGKLAKSFSSTSPTREPDGSIRVTVRPKGEHAFLALFHEYGVAPHLIKISDDLAAQTEAKLRPSKRGRSRKTVTRYANELVESGSLKIGENFVGDMVQHPGHAARPFIRPAFDAKASDAVAAFTAQIGIWATKKLTQSISFDEAA